ncbi:hypothetical protein ELAN_29400 [Elizabethkingia anophelis]|nr:hypothetical protein ELAN_29400 [Elizabethkingia anophelis]
MGRGAASDVLIISILSNGDPPTTLPEITTVFLFEQDTINKVHNTISNSFFISKF